MKNDKLTLNYIVFVALSLGIIFGYAKLFPKPSGGNGAAAQKTVAAAQKTVATPRDGEQSPKQSEIKNRTARRRLSKPKTFGTGGRTVEN